MDRAPGFPEKTSSRRVLLGGTLAGCAAWALGCDRGSGRVPREQAWEEAAWDFPCRHRASARMRPGVGVLADIALQGERLWAAGSEGLVLLDLAGRELRRLEAPFAARCLALDGEGNLWIGGGQRVAALDQTGRVLSAFELSGPSIRRPPLFTGLAAGADALFLADAANRVIQRVDREGNLLGSIGADATPSGLVVPSPYLSIGLDAAGSLLVAHLGRRRVERYSEQGRLLGSWGEPGIRPGRFSGCCNPVGIHADQAGPVLTAEKGLGRLTWFSAEGELLCILGRGVLAPASRNIQVAALGRERVLATDPAAGLIHLFEEA